MTKFRYSHLHSSTSFQPTNLNDGEIALYTKAGEERIIFKNSDGTLAYIGTKDVENAIKALSGTTSGKSAHVTVEVKQENGKISTVTVTEDDIASLAALTAETAARKAVDGQSGQTYAANEGTTYITEAKSLNEADVMLDEAIQGLAEELENLDVSAQIDEKINALDADVTSTDGDFVTVKVTEVDGKITAVNVTEEDIASETALNAEIAARKAVDGQTGQTYAANEDAAYISEATSLNEADVMLDEAIEDVSNNLTTLTSNYTQLAKDVEGLEKDKFGHVVYDKNGKTIKFYASSTATTELGTIDTTDFIKDGMVNNVEVKDDKLVITFNTDAATEDIEIDIADIFNAENYYDKDNVDGLIDAVSGQVSTNMTNISNNTTNIATVSGNVITTATTAISMTDGKLNLTLTRQSGENPIEVYMKAVKDSDTGILLADGANDTIVLSAGTFN